MMSHTKSETGNFCIRRARQDEYDLLNAIKIDGAKLFGEAYQNRPLPKDMFAECVESGDLLIASDANGIPCAFSTAYNVEDDLYLRHLYVLRSYGRMGFGTLLLNEAVKRAKHTNRRAITLTTSGSAPWNAPYYARHGFVILLENMPPYLKRQLDSELEYFQPHNFPAIASCQYCVPRVAMEQLIKRQEK